MVNKNALTLGLALFVGCSEAPNDLTCVENPEALGCVDRGDRQGGEQVIKLGLVLPLTGDSSAAGEGLKNGARLAFGEVEWTIGPYSVELIDIDSESASAGGDAIAAKYAAAIEEHDLVAGLLNWHSSVALSLMDSAADARMAHLFPFGATDAINTKYASDPERYSVWGAKGWPQPGTYVSSYLELMECLLRAGCEEARAATSWSPVTTRIAISTEAGAWGDAFEAGAASKIEDPNGWWATNGWEVAGSVEISADDDATTLADKAQAVADLDVSVLLMKSTSDNVGQFVEQLRLKLDPDPLIIVEGLGWSSASLTSAGASAIGVLDGGFAPYNGDARLRDAVQTFQIEYELEFGEAPSTSSGGLGYDYTRFAIRVLQRAFEKHGSIDRAGVLDVYANEVVTGQLTLDEGVVMSRYAYSEETAPDPVYGIGFYHFPVYQYQDEDRNGEIDFATVFPSVLRDADVVVP